MGIEEAFLIYANCSLKQEPEKLYKIFDEFQYAHIEFEVPVYDRILAVFGHFVFLVKCNKLQADNKFHEYLNSDDSMSLGCFAIAYGAIYGYANNYCEDHCFDRRTKRAILGDNRFVGDDRLKCYECDNLIFQKLLDKIVEGKDLHNISGLMHIMSNVYDNFSKGVEFVRDPVEVEGKFKATVIFNKENFLLDNIRKSNLSSKAFHSFLFKGMVCYSLAEFLLHNDRRKLKKCKSCGDFFIATKLDERIKKCRECSSKNSMSPERRREYQRNYNRKKQQEKKTRAIEARVARFMKQLDITREEALDIIKADSEV